MLLLLLALWLTPFAATQGANPLGSLLKKNPGQGGQTPPPVGPPAESQPASAIPLPDVATRAEALTRLLRDIASQLPTREQLEAVKSTLDEREAPLQAKRKEAETLLAGSPSAMELREQESYWHGVVTEDATIRPQLLAWANSAQWAIQQLEAHQPLWKATLEENRSTPDLGPTLDVIRYAVKNIQTTMSQAQDLLRAVVNLQVQAADQDQNALEMLGRLTRAQTLLQGHLIRRDSLPLWQVLLRRQQGESPEFLGNTVARVISIEAFARDNAGLLAFLAVLLLLSLLAAHRLDVFTRGVEPANEIQAQALELTRHWFALGLLPPLLFSFLLSSQAPLPLIGLTILLLFIPVLTLLQPLIEPPFRRLLHFLLVLYLISAFVSWGTLSAATKREVQFLTYLAVVIVFAYLLRSGRIAPRRPTGRRRLVIFAMRLAVAIAAVGLVANFVGYFRLAQYLGSLTLYSTFVAVVAFTATRVFTILLLAGLSAPSAERLAVVRVHRKGLERWVPRLLQWTGILLWVGATLALLGIRQWVNAWIVRVFSFPIAGGGSDISLGSVLGFFAILLVGYGISSAIRFLLREELFKRFHLKRGVPELISTTLHYLLLLLVVLFAVNAGGVSLNKFTVLTGAFGVGVGFGLQNIINNFVSGLILQFERPIRIGDVVDLGAGVTGTVTRIGIRSSTVQTFQGAEVIIPNASFISGNVTNWTLSEAKRRVELPVGVAYGTNPKLVKELLERPAIQHPDVLTSPEPTAFFKGFGESSLDFELQFWVMQESNAVKVKSEVALEVMRLLTEAGVEIPFPQRDLRLRSVDAEAAAALSRDSAEAEEGNRDLHPRLRSAK